MKLLFMNIIFIITIYKILCIPIIDIDSMKSLNNKKIKICDSPVDAKNLRY